MEDDFLMLEDRQIAAADERSSLLVLLERMVREQGQLGAAERLGVNYKTVAVALETRRLSRRMTQVLELQMLSEENPVFQVHEERLTAMDERLDKLEGIVKEVVAGAEQLRAAVEGHRAEQDRINRAIDRRLGGGPAAQEAVPVTGGARKSAKGGKGVLTINSIEAPEKPTRPGFPRRNYNEVVTVEAANDDSYVYGKAWPLIREWRMLSRGHPREGRTLTWMEKHKRLLEVELALVTEYMLVLPPDNKPIDDLWRTHITNWRLDDLRDVRRRILRRKLLRWVRRLATFGAWWG